MTSVKFVCSLTCLFLGQMVVMTTQEEILFVHQERRFMLAEVGESVTLRCFYKGDDSAWLYWYKQSLGQKPRLVSTFYIYDTKITFQDEFKDSSRFSLSTEHKTNHLIISNVQISDSATYYCANSFRFLLNFTEGTTVHVKGPGVNVPTSIYQSESETITPGGSVTLNCTVHTGSCDGEQSVYWFKNSAETQPGLVYTSGGRNGQCGRKSTSCDYILQLKNLDVSSAGTYYCAVASCGHILFGNGTRLDFEHEGDSLVLVYVLCGALTMTTILVVLLAFAVYKKMKSSLHHCTESHPRSAALSTEETEGGRDSRDLHYAALSVRKPKRSDRKRHDTVDDCVYSSVKL